MLGIVTITRKEITLGVITKRGGGVITHPQPLKRGMLLDKKKRPTLTFPENNGYQAVVRIDD